MRILSNFEDVDFIVKHGRALWLRKSNFRDDKKNASDPAQQMSYEMFRRLTIKEILELMQSGRAAYDEDVTGDKTIVMKKFESREEISEWLVKTDFDALREEIRLKYGNTVSGHVDSENLQFVVTLPSREKNITNADLPQD